ncbi:hypothetical protein RRG08_018604 [Elysia crispata]|uniref:Uncharacterized protein n=1 Tax=Elysia crispata TaxID=231223 RepID=A0AAE1B4J2_9GAST|nr:hypothetical protein RRG08_018604 [Elysia crispata]
MLLFFPCLADLWRFPLKTDGAANVCVALVKTGAVLRFSTYSQPAGFSSANPCLVRTRKKTEGGRNYDLSPGRGDLRQREKKRKGKKDRFNELVGIQKNSGRNIIPTDSTRS